MDECEVLHALCLLAKERQLLTLEHFQDALKSMKPASLRDSDIFVSSMEPVSWNDIGGLDGVKSTIQKVPLVYEIYVQLDDVSWISSIVFCVSWFLVNLQYQPKKLVN